MSSRKYMLLIFIAIAAVLTVLTVMLVVSLTRLGWQSAVTAAWAQAASTAWGLVLAFFLASDERRRAEHRRVRDRIEFLETVLHIAHEARELTDRVERSLEDGRQLPPADFEDVREAIDRLPVELMRNGKLAITIRRMRRVVRHLGEVYGALHGPPSISLMTSGLRSELDRRCARVRTLYTEIEELVETLVQAA